MGLQTDEPDLNTLLDLLSADEKYNDDAALAVFNAYVENQESRDQARALIANRLENFETIMADFLVVKRLRSRPTRA
jgi:hypothetical protein